VPYTVDLNRGQTYQIQDNADLTGTTVTSNHPISTYGFVACTNIPPGSSACDHIVEQLPSTDAWGTSFLSARLGTRAKGDTYRVLADQDGTVVTVDGTDVATLNAGEYYEAVLPPDAVTPANQGVQITASKPALVAQYSNGTSYDGVTSDPFMMLIPPFEQFQSSYTVTTPASGFNINYLNIVIPTASIGSFTLDGGPVDASQFADIGTSGFSSAQLAVALGSHTVSADSGFGVFVYGFADYDSYGYPGGYLLSPIAAVANLTLDQEAYSADVGSDICPIATVTDSGGGALEGITVDFDLDNPAVADSAVTDAAGQASICFSNDVVSTGTLVAQAGLAIGALSDTATVDFVEPGTPIPVAATPVAATPAASRAVTPQFTG
jgi:IgGFc binding protein